MLFCWNFSSIIAKWVKFIGVQKICLSLHFRINFAFDAFQPRRFNYQVKLQSVVCYFLLIIVVQYNLQTKAFVARDLMLSIIWTWINFFLVYILRYRVSSKSGKGEWSMVGGEGGGGWTHLGNGIKGSGDRGLHLFSPFSNPFLASVSILSRKPKKLEDTRINQRFISLYQKCSLFWSRKYKCTSNFYSCNF